MNYKHETGVKSGNFKIIILFKLYFGVDVIYFVLGRGS